MTNCPGKETRKFVIGHWSFLICHRSRDVTDLHGVAADFRDSLRLRVLAAAPKHHCVLRLLAAAALTQSHERSPWPRGLIAPWPAGPAPAVTRVTAALTVRPTYARPPGPHPVSATLPSEPVPAADSFPCGHS